MDTLKDSPAGITERAFALIIDIIITFSCAFLLRFIFSFSVPVTAVIFSYGYGVFLPLLWNGYTIGKRILGIRISDMEGKKLNFSTMLIRGFLAQLLYQATFVILTIVSVYFVSTREDKRSIHDLLARTYVTSNPPGYA